jgi:hypothetical protein
MADPVTAAVITTSLFAGIKTGTTQSTASGDTKGVQSGLKQVGQGDLNKPNQKLQNNLLKPISTPQVAPTPDSAAVQAQRANTLTQLQQRSGRASTLLTNQFGG